MMLRSLVLLLCLTSIAQVTCTAQNEECYRATLAGTVTPAQLKSLIAQLPLLVGDGKWEFTEATSTLELRLRSALTREHFETWASGIGLTISEYIHVAGPDDPWSRSRYFNHPDFPVYLNTGDNLADDQRYEQEKSTWIATHPEAYQELIAPVPVSAVDQTQAR